MSSLQTSGAGPAKKLSSLTGLILSPNCRTASCELSGTPSANTHRMRRQHRLRARRVCWGSGRKHHCPTRSCLGGPGPGRHHTRLCESEAPSTTSRNLPCHPVWSSGTRQNGPARSRCAGLQGRGGPRAPGLCTSQDGAWAGSALSAPPPLPGLTVRFADAAPTRSGGQQRQLWAPGEHPAVRCPFSECWCHHVPGTAVGHAEVAPDKADPDLPQRPAFLSGDRQTGSRHHMQQ